MPEMANVVKWPSLRSLAFKSNFKRQFEFLKSLGICMENVAGEQGLAICTCMYMYIIHVYLTVVWMKLVSLTSQEFCWSPVNNLKSHQIQLFTLCLLVIK